MGVLAPDIVLAHYQEGGMADLVVMVSRSRMDPHTLSRLRVSDTHLLATFRG